MTATTTTPTSQAKSRRSEPSPHRRLPCCVAFQRGVGTLGAGREEAGGRCPSLLSQLTLEKKNAFSYASFSSHASMAVASARLSNTADCSGSRVSGLVPAVLQWRRMAWRS